MPVTINGRQETISKESALACGMKIKKEADGSEHIVGSYTYTIVKVDDPYYSHARKFHNGHLTYLSPYS